MRFYFYLQIATSIHSIGLLAAHYIITALVDLDPCYLKKEIRNNKEIQYTFVKDESAATDLIHQKTIQALEMVLPSQSDAAIQLKTKQVIKMFNYEIQAVKKQRNIIFFLHSGNSVKIQRFLYGFMLYLLWKDLENFIRWQHNQATVTEPQPIFPQEDFMQPFLLD